MNSEDTKWLLAFEHHYRTVLPQLRARGIHYAVQRELGRPPCLQFRRHLPLGGFPLDPQGMLHDAYQRQLSAEQLLRYLAPTPTTTGLPVLMGLLLSGLLLLTVYIAVGSVVTPLLLGGSMPLWGVGSAGLLLVGLSLLKLLR
jgi:hypothetical protein